MTAFCHLVNFLAKGNSWQLHLMRQGPWYANGDFDSGLGLLLVFGGEVLAEGESVYRTGLKAEGAVYAVSPDGRQLVISSGHLKHGLQMLDLHTGLITTIAESNGHFFRSPA